MVLDDYISLVCVPDKLSNIMSGFVGYGSDPLEDLERHDRHSPSFVEPHLFDGPHVSGSVHPAQPCIAVSHKAMFLHFHVPQVFAVWGACVASARVDVQVVLQEDVPCTPFSSFSLSCTIARPSSFSEENRPRPPSQLPVLRF